MSRYTPAAMLAALLAAGCTEAPYRLPYIDGTEVEVTADHRDHANPDAEMFDFRAVQEREFVVATKPGWVREIQDTGDGPGDNNNFVWIEHPLDYCQPPAGLTSGPASPADCRACVRGPGKCNEWTLYAHMARDSVHGAAGLTEADWVEAGQIIGIEGNVGFVDCGTDTGPLCGRHVHFAVFEIDRDHPEAAGLPTENGDYETYAEKVGRPERVPLFCTAAGLRLVRTGQIHIAAPCP